MKRTNNATLFFTCAVWMVILMGGIVCAQGTKPQDREITGNAGAAGSEKGDFVRKMDSVFEQQFRDGVLMGNVLVGEQGKIVYQRSFGYRDIENRQSNKAASVFGLASISKQVTSTAILQLKEAGKLRLEDRFVDYFPDFPFPAITLRQMLTHTSGLPDYELFDSLIDKQPMRIFTNADIIPALKLWSKGLLFEPGADWQYSNMGYCLLGLLIEKLSGQTLQNYFVKHIFQPAGMQHTYIENLILKRANPDRTVNYEYPALYDSVPVRVDSIPNDHKMIYNLGGFYGQGGLFSTTEDLFRFDKAFFSGQLIGTADIAEALTPVRLNDGKITWMRDVDYLGSAGYGFGWFVLADTSHGKIVLHDGGRPGISSFHLHNLRTDQTVIVLQNMPNPSANSAVCAYHILNAETFVAPRSSLIVPYARTLVNEGADAAMTRLNILRRDTTFKMPNDYLWLILGWQLFEKEKCVDLSVEVFKIGALLFPDGWYMSQGYGAALEKQGKKELAIQMYKKAIAQWPKADYAPGRLKILEAEKAKEAGSPKSK